MTKSAQPALSILVVDDNVVHRRMSQTILTAAGYAVRLAEGGPQALAAFEKAPADLVILDVHMPGMDGFEVCRRLRALPDGKRVPILFLTDLSDLSSPEQAQQSGGDDFLNKPINRIELCMRIRLLLRERHLQDILASLLEGSREAIAVLDAKAQITRWSRQASALLGWSANEAVGQSLSSLLIPQAQRQEFEEELSRVLATTSATSAPSFRRTAWTAQRQDAQQIPVELSVTLVRTASETSLCVFIRGATATGGNR